jgi:hypothetical protein
VWEDWDGGVVFTKSKLPPLPLLEVAPLSTICACTDFILSLEEIVFHIGVRMPVSPSLALGLGSGSDSGSTSAAGPTSAPPFLLPFLPLLPLLLCL